MSVNDDIADELIALAVDLDRLSTTMTQEVWGSLYLLEEELERLINKYDIEGAARDTTRVRRMQRLLDQTRATIARTYKVGGPIQRPFNSNLETVARITNEGVVDAFESAFKAEIFQPQLTREQLKAMVKETIVDGVVTRDWWRKQSADLRLNYTREIQKGVLAGESNADIIRRVRGTAVSPRRFYDIKIGGKIEKASVTEGGIMKTSRRHAEALVRTSTNAINNRVVTETYRELPEAVEGVYALVTLDTRTSDICIARSGASWDLVTGEPLKGSPVQEPFPGPPPWHYNCRTVLTPITRSWDDILGNLGFRKKKELESEVPLATQQASTGLVPRGTTYEEWLAGRPASVQKEVLGPTKYRLWKEEKLTLSQLLDQSGNPLTVAELLRKYDID